MGVCFVGVATHCFVSSTDGESGNAPGISSLSCSEASFEGTVRGVLVEGASWDSDTRLGVVDALSRRRAELRRAMGRVSLRGCVSYWSRDMVRLEIGESGSVSLVLTAKHGHKHPTSVGTA